MRTYGRLLGRFARNGQGNRIHRDFAGGGVLAPRGMAVDGVPYLSDVGNDFHFLSHYLDDYNPLRVYHDTGFSE